ncbi:MAG: C10 family peptidase [Bacteroidaceae bacterium]|nr:C10 family peptidase [Bacteroidaceae bacterium]
MNAQHVTEEQALQKAQAFLNQKATKGGRRGAPLKMKQLENVAQNDAFYIFNAEQNGGYVIVSGDERTDEILGYSTEGNIDPQRMPENMKAWLEGYEKQIVSIPANARRAPSNVPLHPAVEPLITSKWDQDSPYNLQCPEIDGQHCPTGCVATAMAQIMYYHKWPKGMTTAIPAYDYGSYSGNYGKYHEDALPPTTFEWDLMKDTYKWYETGAEAQAVAKLMRYCGQSVEMNYTPWESAAGLNAASLINYFGYDKAAMRVGRALYNNQEWDELIYGEIAANRPIWYFGGSHSFVCDGYDGNGLYHINWGWGGSSDGYFLLSLLNGYSSIDQFVIVGILPSVSLPSSMYKVSADLTGYPGNRLDFDVMYYNNTDSTFAIDCALGLLKDDGSVEMLTMLYESAPMNEFNAYYGGFRLTTKDIKDLSSILNLPNGTYSLVALWKDHSETTWHYDGEFFKARNYCYRYIELTVDGERRKYEPKIYFHHSELTVTEIEPVGNMVTGEEQRFAIHCVNEGKDFQTCLYLFASQTEEMGYAHTETPLYLDKDTEETVYLSFYPEQEGTYHVWVAEYSDGSNILAQTDITVSKPLELDVLANYFDWSTMTMPMTVTNNGEVPYDREVAVRICPRGDYEKEDAGQVFKSGKLHIEPGQSVDIDIDCTGLSIDNLYIADLMYCKNPNSDVMSKVVNWGMMLYQVEKGQFTQNGIRYVIVDTERHYVFTRGCTTDVPTQLTVPSTVVSPNDGLTYTVKGIGENFCQYNDVTTLSFSYGITTIDSYSVHECESLETIVLPGSLKRIGTCMINQCPNLKAIYSKAHEAPLLVDYSVSNYLIGLNESYDNITLYVPKGSRTSYAKAWPQFTNIVEMDVEAMQPPTNTLMGDMNGDGKRTLLDVVILVNRIMEER